MGEAVNTWRENEDSAKMESIGEHWHLTKWSYPQEVTIN